jgi:hypothetical protein
MKRYEFNPVVEPLIGKMESSGLLLIPQNSYYEWLRYLIIEKYPSNIQDTEFFLLPQFNSPEKTEEFCRLFFDLFFQYKLKQISKDPAFWPVNRTYEMFQQWFDVKITSTVLKF